MNESIKKFLGKLEADPELQAKLSETRDPDTAYALASSLQGGFTKEEFIEEMTRIRESMAEDLSEDDLAKSSGGSTVSYVVSGVVSFVSSVSAASCAAAASL